jgi:eukaryotic-like serine/threonine-protein kinase
MSLPPGTRVGAYEVSVPLGAGGMGEVYRARDSKLNREVALKVLPAALAADPDRLARFTREAQTLAALNHPSIATIYGVEEAGGIRALIMELVAGDDLSVLIARGPIPLNEALPIARQIAEALEAAHEQGIVHRDLKPANVKIRHDGTVKVLDFGLAKALSPEGAGATSDVLNSPTITAPAMTAAGMILGTAAYMAPEQARGKAVDKRADIWAFGVVLYEMLTGARLFDGESVAETLGLIFAREPDLTKLPAATPAGVHALIARCLVKNPRERLRDIGDARLQVDDAISGRGEQPRAAAPVVAVERRKPWALWVAASLIALAAAAAGWLGRPAAPTSPIRLSIAMPPGEQVMTFPAIASDGQVIAYVSGRTAATSKLYLRTLGDFVARPVANSVGAQYPFFSPDGRGIAFFAGGKLRRASVAGGAAIDIAPSATPWGGTWDTQGRIVYTTGLGSGLWRVPADGGMPEQLTKPDGADAGYAHVFPERLPGTGDLLFAYWGRTFQAAQLSEQTRTWRAITPPSKTIVVSTYATSGHLLTNDGAGAVLASRWDPTATSPVRPETPVIDGVYWTLGGDRSWINVSENGTAVYVPGDPSNRHVVWVDRQGRSTQLPGSGEIVNQATLSRDGHRVIYGSTPAHWVLDLRTGARTRLISEVRSWHGGWLPGDARIAVSSNKDGDWDLYTIASSGGEMTPLLKRPFAQHVQAVASNGSIVYLERQPETGSDLWTLALDGRTTPLVRTRFNEDSASISADGRFVAYVSDESGRREVYAIPASGQGDRVAVSINGGKRPCVVTRRA